MSINYRESLLCLLSFGILMGFKYTGVYFPESVGWLHIVLFGILFTTIISAQIFRFRLIVKDILISRILREDYWVTRWLRKSSRLMLVIVVAGSILLSVNLMSFLYTSGTSVDIALLADAFVFAFLLRKVRFALPDRAFQVDIAALMHEYTPFIVNVALLFVVLTSIAFIDTSHVYNLSEFSKLPDYATAEIQHPWRLFRGFARTVFLVEITLRSLRSLSESFGWFLYITMYITSVSLASNIAVSLIYKAITGTALFSNSSEMSEGQK